MRSPAFLLFAFSVDELSPRALLARPAHRMRKLVRAEQPTESADVLIVIVDRIFALHDHSPPRSGRTLAGVLPQSLHLLLFFSHALSHFRATSSAQAR